MFAYFEREHAQNEATEGLRLCLRPSVARHAHLARLGRLAGGITGDATAMTIMLMVGIKMQKGPDRMSIS